MFVVEVSANAEPRDDRASSCGSFWYFHALIAVNPATAASSAGANRRMRRM